MVLTLLTVILPFFPMLMTLAFIKFIIRDKENLINKNAKYPNSIPSRYAFLWVISVISLIGYFIIECMNFIPDFSQINEMIFLYSVAFIYSILYSALFYGIPPAK